MKVNQILRAFTGAEFVATENGELWGIYASDTKEVRITLSNYFNSLHPRCINNIPNITLVFDDKLTFDNLVLFNMSIGQYKTQIDIVNLSDEKAYILYLNYLYVIGLFHGFDFEPPAFYIKDNEDRLAFIRSFIALFGRKLAEISTIKENKLFTDVLIKFSGNIERTEKLETILHLIER